MKSILTLIFILFIGVLGAQAQDAKTETKVATIEMGIVTFNTIEYNAVEVVKENATARLYKFKNSRVKKALAFTTKRNKAKMA